MIRLIVVCVAFMASIIWLPMVTTGQDGPPPPLVIPAPAGVTPHLVNTQVLVDGAGVVFAKTRPGSETGEIVWKVVNNEPVIVLEPGPSAAYGNGELVVWPDGYARLVTVTEDRRIAVYLVPDWVPTP